jgi:hypothetical protein
MTIATTTHAPVDFLCVADLSRSQLEYLQTASRGASGGHRQGSLRILPRQALASRRSSDAHGRSGRRAGLGMQLGFPASDDHWVQLALITPRDAVHGVADPPHRLAHALSEGDDVREQKPRKDEQHQRAPTRTISWFVATPPRLLVTAAAATSLPGCFRTALPQRARPGR